MSDRPLGSFSLDAIWSSLLDGDPGPALAFSDALLDNDMPFAAGGFLRDLAERLHDVGDALPDENQRHAFTEAIHAVLLHALDHDEKALADLLAED